MTVGEIAGVVLLLIVTGALAFVLGNFLLAQVLKRLNGKRRKAALAKLEEYKQIIKDRPQPVE